MSVTIEHGGDGTVVHGTSRGDGTAGVLKAASFRWGRSISAWFLPRPWSYSTRSAYVAQAASRLREEGFDVEIDDKGPEVSTTAAERFEARAERAGDRAEALDAKAERREQEGDELTGRARTMGDAIPFGQPILVGHYSEGRDRRYRDRMNATYDKGHEAHQEATEAARRAGAARAGQRHRESVPATLRRIQRHEAELRKLELALARPVEREGADVDRWREIARARAAALRDEIAHDQAHVAEREAAGVKVWGPADFKPGDLVTYWGGTRRVVRVNAKTLSVETEYSWTDKLPYDAVRGRPEPPTPEEEQ
jgi:hypothetical protein